MSRSGYNDDCEQWDLIRWRGAVKSALRGKRGQAFLREMRDALDALPEPRLVSHELVIFDDEKIGGVCAIGSVGVARGVDLGALDPEDSKGIAAAFGIANAMVREIEYINDELGPYCGGETPEDRFTRVRNWVVQSIAATPEPHADPHSATKPARVGS